MVTVKAEDTLIASFISHMRRFGIEMGVRVKILLKINSACKIVTEGSNNALCDLQCTLYEPCRIYRAGCKIFYFFNSATIPC